MLSSHLFHCLPCLLPPLPYKMVLARPDERETWPYHCSLRHFAMVRRSSRGPIACWILAQTSSLVTPKILYLRSYIGSLTEVKTVGGRGGDEPRKLQCFGFFLVVIIEYLVDFIVNTPPRSYRVQTSRQIRNKNLNHCSHYTSLDVRRGVRKKVEWFGEADSR